MNINKEKIFLILITVVVIVGGILYLFRDKNEKSFSLETPRQVVKDYKNITYAINDRPVTLVNGYTEEEAAPGSTSKIVTEYFGNPVLHDFNGDGRQDIAFLITQKTGGSGTFFYVVAALDKEEGYLGSKNAYFLGDRIAPQSTSMAEGTDYENVIIVNYTDRLPEESFAAKPSVGKTAWLKFNPATLQLVIANQNAQEE